MRTEVEWVVLDEANDAASAVLRELASITRFYAYHLDAVATRYALRRERETAAMFAGATLVANEIAEALDDEAFRVLVGEAL